MYASTLIALQSERNHLANILHSHVGSLLTAAGLQLDALRLDCANLSPEFPARAGEIQKRLEDAMRVVRQLSAELNPNVAERLGLRTALKLLVDKVEPAFRCGAILEFTPGECIPTTLAGVLYSIAEQAVENAVLHAGACRLEVRVSASGGTLVLEICDDGCGFDLENCRAYSMGLGLPLMFQYAGQCNARVRILSERGAGTVVRATLDVRSGFSASLAAEGHPCVENAHAE